MALLTKLVPIVSVLVFPLESASTVLKGTSLFFFHWIEVEKVHKTGTYEPILMTGFVIVDEWVLWFMVEQSMVKKFTFSFFLLPISTLRFLQ